MKYARHILGPNPTWMLQRVEQVFVDTVSSHWVEHVYKQLETDETSLSGLTHRIEHNNLRQRLNEVE